MRLLDESSSKCDTNYRDHSHSRLPELVGKRDILYYIILYIILLFCIVLYDKFAQIFKLTCDDK